MNTLESRPVPKRAKSFQHTRRFLPVLALLEKLLQQPIMMTEQQYQQLIDGLWQGDTLMDALVDWLFEDNTRQRKQLFEQALHEGTASIKDCPDILQQFFTHVETRPDWLDQAQLQQAVAFMHSVGLNANYVLRDLALMGGYLLAGFNQALVMTGALNKGASQR